MVFFERCVKSVSLIGDSVDRTAETQGQVSLDFPERPVYNEVHKIRASQGFDRGPAAGEATRR